MGLLSSGKNRKLFAIGSSVILLLIAIIVFRSVSQKGGGDGEIGIGDVLNSTSVRRGSYYDIVILDAHQRMAPVVSTPLACWYDITDGSSSLLPALIKGSGAADRFYALSGRGTPLRVVLEDEGSDGLFKSSSELARERFQRSDGILLVSDCNEGYSLALTAAPISSYLNIPIVVVSHNTEERDIRDLAEGLDASYLIAASDHTVELAKRTGLDYVPMIDREKAWNDTASVIMDRFGRLDYITLTNPRDTEPAFLREDLVQTQIQDVDSVLVDTGSVDLDLMGESEVTHSVNVPEGIVNLRIYVNFTDVKGLPLDPVKEAVGISPISFLTLIDPQGRLAASAPSFSASTGRNYVETLIIENPGTYWLTVKVYYGIKGLSTMGGTSMGISRFSGSYEVESHAMVLSDPHLPLYEELSMMAPYLSASRGGMVLADPSFELTDGEYAERAAGRSSGPWYDRELLQLGRDKVNANVGILSKHVNALPEELSTSYLEGKGWLALLGGGNMIPMYYQDKEPSWEENPVWGTGWATDLPYSLDLSLSVGRPLGRTLSDVSALIARTLFYEEYTESFIRELEAEYGASGSFKDHFHFLAGEGGGRTGWLFHQREFSQTAEQHGFTSEVYMQDSENDRQFLVQSGAFERANYFEMILHGDWSWFSPELNGFDRYSTGVKVSDLMERPFDWELGPSVFNSGVCLLGRIGGLRPEQSITQAFFASGINAFFCATRSTGSEAKAGPIEEALLFDDLSVGEAIRKDKRDNPEVPTYFVRTLFGDPAFNPYEPENGYADQGRPLLMDRLP
ncbi:MAG: hypothetical protein ACMUIE_03695 [Thermoplasmatota archaeon]